MFLQPHRVLSAIGLTAAVGALAAAVVLAPAHAAAQPTYLVDTGPGGASSIGAASLFGSGSTTCSPQPGCGLDFQHLGFRITLPQAATVTGIDLWVAPFSSGGAMSVRIREEVNALPGVNAPPLFSANSLYAKTYNNAPNVFAAAQWVTFGGFDAVLAAGTYWITFEPVAGTDLHYSVPGGAPAPLSKYAFNAFGNPAYVAWNLGMGVRVAGTTFDGAAFGTATRLTAVGGFDTCCGPFDIDIVQEGTRDFTRFGNAGPALTSSYIFQLGAAHVHGRGRLIENGLSAGAYASTNSFSVGSGRGIAYRTLVNLGAEARTIRANAVLSGSFGTNGGVARGAVYAFDTGLFTSTLEAAEPTTPGQLLLGADDAQAIRNTGTSISLARFFPSEALLGADFEVADFAPSSVQSVPLQTGLLTLQPGEMVTVMFDVAVYAGLAGDVNFGNTLLPAPVFISDSLGNPVSDVVAVGPSAMPAPVIAAIAASPSSATTPVGGTHSVTATATASGGAPVPDTAVEFRVTSGPNAGTSGTVMTDANGDATFTYPGSVLGADTIEASAGTVTAAIVTNTWVPGAADHITLAPADATIAAGASQPYTVSAFDAFGNSLGDVTTSAVLEIAPDGACAGASCTATAAGPHTVTATAFGTTAQASLAVAALACDIDGDAVVTVRDLTLLRSRAGQVASGPGDPSDPNGDGRINIADVRYCQVRLTP